MNCSKPAYFDNTVMIKIFMTSILQKIDEYDLIYFYYFIQYVLSFESRLHK